MIKNLEKLAYEWITIESENVNITDYYCQTRDVFQVKNNKMLNNLIKHDINENKAYLISATIGEIGNNSFDHNLGNWPDIMGIFFSYEIKNQILEIILADRGQGIFKTLKKVKPKLKNDSDALQTAFFEKISGRAPENRGNGLKFVKNSVKEMDMNLFFASGNSQAELNHQINIKQTNQNIRGCLAILKIKI